MKGTRCRTLRSLPAMLSTAEYAVLTSAYPILDRLPAGLQDAVRQEALGLRAPAGEILLAGGSPCLSLPLIVAGAARAVMPIRSGRELTLYRLLPGEVCFLTASCLLAGGGKRSGSLVAELDLAGAWLPQAAFHRLVDGSPPFRRFVFSAFHTRAAGLLGLIEDIYTKPLEQRLAFILLQKGPLIDSTHQMLADEVGTVREVISRILKDFEARKIILLGRRKIHVADPAALSQLASYHRDPDHRLPTG